MKSKVRTYILKGGARWNTRSSVALVFIVTFVAAIDQFNFLESLYQPIVTGAVIGLILGDLNTGLLVGGTYQLMTIGNMPIGGAQPPNAVIGGIMAAILAIATGLEPNAAVGLAIPFALLGQLGVTWSSRLCRRSCPLQTTWLTTLTPRVSSV